MSVNVGESGKRIVVEGSDEPWLTHSWELGLPEVSFPKQVGGVLNEGSHMCPGL